jgi:NADPH:quinone reductase-like Zn-dependent oxidoreductase
MKAIVWTRYGSPQVLQLQEVEIPEPKDDQVRIKVHASTVTAGDCEMRRMDFPLYLGLPIRIWVGVFKPRGTTIPGTEVAGEVDAVGPAVTKFKVGDQVFGSAGMGFGANAEYICLPETSTETSGSIARKPATMTYEEAATIPFGGRDALHFIRLGNLQPGQKILINGAGGSIGIFAVQLAKLAGAEVTAIDSGPKLDMLRQFGADHVVDYTREDFSANGVVYDVIFDVVGTLRFSRTNPSLKEHGIYLLANPTSQILSSIWTRLTTNRKVVMQAASGTVEDLDYLRQLIEDGKLRTYIDRRFPLKDTAEAHRYVEKGGKLGNVVISVVPMA